MIVYFSLFQINDRLACSAPGSPFWHKSQRIYRSCKRSRCWSLVSPLMNDFDEDDDTDTYYNNENGDNDSLASSSSIVTPTSINNNLLFQNSSENQVVPLQNVTSNNSNLSSLNSSENQVVPSHIIARFQLNECGQREFFGAYFQWMQQQMTSTRNPLFSNGRFIGSIVTQRAIAEQTIEQGNTENVLCLLLY